MCAKGTQSGDPLGFVNYRKAVLREAASQLEMEGGPWGCQAWPAAPGDTKPLPLGADRLRDTRKGPAQSAGTLRCI